MAPQNPTPTDIFFALVSGILNTSYIASLIEDSEAYIKNGYLFWPVASEEEYPIYYAANPKLREIYELEFPDQDPVNGIPIRSDEDLIWLIGDLTEFIQELEEQEFLYPRGLVFPDEAQYFCGATRGSVHSLS